MKRRGFFKAVAAGVAGLFVAAPGRTLYGRPVRTAEDRKLMSPPFPPESENWCEQDFTTSGTYANSFNIEGYTMTVGGKVYVHDGNTWRQS